jgi:hypothetical protein
MKRLIVLTLLATMFLGVGGCIYDPAYYHRPSVVYDDGYAEPYDEGYAYGPGYSYGPGPYYYDPWYYGWGFPFIGFSYYGRYGSHHHSYHHTSSSSHTYHHH